LLREVGVDFAQGIAIAPPAPLGDLLCAEGEAPAAVGPARAWAH